MLVAMQRARLGRFSAALALAAGMLLPSTGNARPAKQKQKTALKSLAKPKPKSEHAVFDADWASAPAAKYAALDGKACLAEAKARGIPLEEVKSAPGVLIPVRLTGPVNGVRYHTELAEKDRATSPFEVFDCRLVLALHDFGAILTAHDIDEALIFSAWRPPPKSWAKDKLGTRHTGALAVDIRVLNRSASASNKDKDLIVLRDWKPARDKPPCGEKAPPISPDTDAAKEIRSIYCAASDARIFSSMLGPNFNKEHENHFHIEVTPEVKWRLTE